MRFLCDELISHCDELKKMGRIRRKRIGSFHEYFSRPMMHIVIVENNVRCSNSSCVYNLRFLSTRYHNIAMSSNDWTNLQKLNRVAFTNSSLGVKASNIFWGYLLNHVFSLSPFTQMPKTSI